MLVDVFVKNREKEQYKILFANIGEGMLTWQCYRRVINLFPYVKIVGVDDGRQIQI